MRQIVNIKKVIVDSDLKVSVQLEFIATDRVSKENIFELIQMQGEAAEVIITPAQTGLKFTNTQEAAYEHGYTA